jgi:glycosyltransferase involved in cell wall biosynthesis
VKIALITNHPAPYRQRLYGELAKRLPGFHVLYEATENRARKWGGKTASDYDHQFISKAPIDRLSNFRRGAAAAYRLRADKPDAVVATGFGASALAARQWCGANGRPYVGLSGATALADRTIPTARRGIRVALARSADGWIAYGDEAKEYLVQLGVPPARVMAGGNPWGTAAVHDRPPAPATPRRIAFVGRLVWTKAWWIPVQAAALARESGLPLELTIVGDGPGAPALERLLEESLPDADWRRHVPPSEMAELYSSIDLLLVPSLIDQWPIVASEAAAERVPTLATHQPNSGLPALMSTAGEQLTAGSVDAVVNALHEVSRPEAYAEAVTRTATARDAFSPEAVANRWVEHLDRLLT